MAISEKIDKIIDRRLGRNEWEGKGRLQQIEKVEITIQDLQKRIDELQTLLNLINHQNKEQSGAYYMMLQKDPQMEDKLKSVNTEKVKKAIIMLKKELELLKRRFSRQSVQIAMIGRERQGKSKLIQSITNLDNMVIPAFDGSSCTGTVSVIHNYDGPFRTDLTFFNRSEFIKIVNDKLERFFPEKDLSIYRIDEIPSLRERIGQAISSDAIRFKRDYIEHYNDYAEWVDHSPISLDDKAKVAEFVSQYRPLHSEEEAPQGFEVETETLAEGTILRKVLYFKYLTVKSANIFTRFEYADSGKLVLVDTIGIGPKDDGSIRQAMYEVLEKDCDGAIDVFRPDAIGGNVDDKQVEILTEIYKRFPDRKLDRWFVYVINEVKQGQGKNTHRTQECLKQAKTLLQANDASFAWTRIIDCNDQNDVIENLVLPQLTLITENLDEIDNSMIHKAQTKLDDVYAEYVLLCKAVNAVVSSSFSNQQTIHLFDQLYKKLTLSNVMQTLDNTKFICQDEECQEIAQRLVKIAEEEIYDVLPDEEQIKEDVDAGIKPDGTIFAEQINQYRNAILDLYQEVNNEIIGQLQENVKMEMITLLFENGLLKNIPLAGYNVSDGPSVKWLQTLVDEVVVQEKYPQVYNALQLILNYQVNIEGLIEYNIAKSLHIINTMYPEFTTIPFVPANSIDVDERAQHISEELFHRVTHIQKNLLSWVSDYSRIPSHSFYARVHQVRERLFLSEEGKEQLRYLYLDNSGSIWREEIRKINTIANAFGDWNDICDKLNKLLNKKFYVF